MDSQGKSSTVFKNSTTVVIADFLFNCLKNGTPLANAFFYSQENPIAQKV